jgi:hypothetical protein
MGLVQKAFSDIITFSRSSNATRIGPTGRVEYAPHNLILQSQTFDNASWTKNASTVTANAIAAPDGTVTADKLIANSGTNLFAAVTQSASITNGLPYTFSLYVKKDAFRYIYIYADGAPFNYGQVRADLNTNTIVTGSGSVTSVGNSWVRVTANFTAVSGGATTLFVGATDSSNNFNTTGDGTSGIYLWGAQLSVGPYPLDYTPTTSAAVYGPRFDYDPVTLAARGLLVEEQRTNLLTYSEQFDAWAKSVAGDTVTANAGVAPDGTTTADKLIADTTSSGGHRVFQSASTSGAHTLSVFAKASGYGSLVFTASANNWVYFNLSAGTVSSSLGGTGWSAATITDFGNGWYRCTATTSNSNTAYYIATSYIPTIASTVTRSADVASVNTLSPWFNATTGTLYTEFDSIGFRSNNNEVARFNDGTVNNQLGIAANGTPSIVFEVTSGGVDQAAITGSSVSANTVYKAAASFAANSFALSVGGALAGTDTSGTVPTVSALTLMNRSDGLRAMNGHLRRLSFYPRVLSTAELNALTA